MSKSLKSVYLIHGDDEYQVELAVKRILAQLLETPNSELNNNSELRTPSSELIDGRVETVGDTLRLLRSIRDALLADDLFSGGGDKVVYVRDPSFLTIDRVARSEDVKSGVATLTQQIKDGLPEGTTLVVSTVRVNRATAFYKACVAKGNVTDTGTGLNARAKNEAAAMLINDMLPKLGLKMSSTLQRSFLSRVGSESRRIASELEKLACYCGDKKTVTEDDINAITSSGAVSEIWDFTDAFANRDRTALMRQLKIQLTQGENAIRMTNSIITTIGDLLLLRDALDRGWARPAGTSALSWDNLPEEVAEGLSLAEKDPRSALSGWRLGKIMRSAALWKTNELRAARHHILTLREELVSLQLPEEYLLTKGLLQAIGCKATKRN